jgi:hypothetical protein
MMTLGACWLAAFHESIDWAGAGVPCYELQLPNYAPVRERGNCEEIVSGTGHPLRPRRKSLLWDDGSTPAASRSPTGRHSINSMNEILAVCFHLVTIHGAGLVGIPDNQPPSGEHDAAYA